MIFIIIGLVISIIINIYFLLHRKDGTKKYKKLFKQKKQSEVILGYITEKLAPFLDDFKYDAKDVQFLGQPIDYIHFGEDSITFIEVKSGKSQLSKKQRKLKKLIQDKQVNWDVYRVNEKPKLT